MFCITNILDYAGVGVCCFFVDSGCICCSAKDDFVNAIDGLVKRQREMERQGEEEGSSSPVAKQKIFDYILVVSNAKMMSGSGIFENLSCLSGMTNKFLVRVQEETFLPVMQKRSLSCEKRNTKKRRYFSSCLPVRKTQHKEAQIFLIMLARALQSIHYSQRSSTSFQTQTFSHLIG